MSEGIIEACCCIPMSEKNNMFLQIFLSLLIYITNILDQSHFVDCNIFTKQKNILQ